MRYRPHQESAAARIVHGSAFILGWSNYFKIAHNFARAAAKLDHQAFWIATKSLCRKFDISTAQCLRKYRRGNYINFSEGLMLRKASETKMSLDFRAPTPYNPGTGLYLDDLDWEATFRDPERKRPGRMDFKVLVLYRDGYRCRKCGTSVTHETSEADHIQPVNSFANVAQANTFDNIQTLCLTCHREKTYAR